jgi:hypothetical protein
VTVEQGRVFLGGVEGGELGELGNGGEGGERLRRRGGQRLRCSRATGVKRLKGLKSLNFWGVGESRFFAFAFTGDGPHPLAPSPTAVERGGMAEERSLSSFGISLSSRRRRRVVLRSAGSFLAPGPPYRRTAGIARPSAR